METVHINEDPGTDWRGDYEILVTDYEYGSYEGFGYALLLRPDGTVEGWGLSHCSCYGPGDDGPYSLWKSVDEFRVASEDVKFDYDGKLLDKFLELLPSVV